LQLDPDIESSLLNLGIKSMGQLVNFPVQSLVERFGAAGKLAHELAQGQDNRSPTIPTPETKFECLVDMGGAVSSLNETTFALKSMLDRLSTELTQHGLWAEELVLSFYNEDDKFNERLLKLIRPTSHAKFLLQVIKLSLEGTPLEREFTKIKLGISRCSKELWEQSSIDSNKLTHPRHRSTLHATAPGCNPLSGQHVTSNGEAATKLSSALLLLLQRFLTSIGSNITAKAIASDHYTFDNAGAWVPVAQKSFSDSVIPINLDYADQIEGGLLPSDMVLRRHSAQVLVELKDDVPSAINYEKQWYRIKCISKPEYLSVLWWDRLSSKDYYRVLAEPTRPRSISSKDIETQCAYLMLLTHDKHSGAWHIEGFFD
jgi:hypothetical protein